MSSTLKARRSEKGHHITHISNYQHETNLKPNTSQIINMKLTCNLTHCIYWSVVLPARSSTSPVALVALPASPKHKLKKLEHHPHWELREEGVVRIRSNPARDSGSWSMDIVITRRKWPILSALTKITMFRFIINSQLNYADQMAQK